MHVTVLSDSLFRCCQTYLMFQLWATFWTNNRNIPLFDVAHYRDDIIGRELNLVDNCKVSNAQHSALLRPKPIKTNGSDNLVAEV